MLTGVCKTRGPSSLLCLLISLSQQPEGKQSTPEGKQRVQSSAGAWELLTKSMTPILAFLPLPASLGLGCSPAWPADARPALLCSALVSPVAKEERGFGIPEHCAGRPSRLPQGAAALSAAQKLFVCILQGCI